MWLELLLKMHGNTVFMQPKICQFAPILTDLSKIRQQQRLQSKALTPLPPDTPLL